MLRPRGLLRTWRRTLETLSSISKSKKADGNTNQPFVDFRRVVLEGGTGGDGCVAFSKLFANPNAGPCGGDGGNGGHVLIRASSQCHDLSHVAGWLRAKNGVRGQGSSCHGASADHLQLLVPLGTCIRDESGASLCDLRHDGDLYIGARGGAGGKGNAFFLSQAQRAPNMAECGAKGESRRLELELKVIAAVGMVGFPNAGKSSLLRAISRARPKVAPYAFTTLRPHVGVVEKPGDTLTRLTVADIPGLVLGAHQDRGLGFAFLRHIERCQLLVFVLDIAVPSGAPAPLLRGPLEQLRALKAELDLFQPGLSTRPSLLLANKCDLVERTEDIVQELKEESGLPVVAVSAKRGDNVESFVREIFAIHERHKE